MTEDLHHLVSSHHPRTGSTYAEDVTSPADEAVAWCLEREVRQVRVVLEFLIDGDPASKARARFTGRGSTSRAYTPDKTFAAEQQVGWTARAAGAGPPDADKSFGLLAVFFTATWQRRDADNMLKLVSDGLTGIVWKDDSQVTEMAARIVRADPEPRTHVQVYETFPQRPDLVPCPVCGQPVRSYKSVTYKTCSRACSMAANRPVSWTCRTCGKTEMRSLALARYVYCDVACRRADPAPRVRQAR